MAIFIVIITFASPIFIAFFLKMNADSLMIPSFKQKYESFYSSIRISSRGALYLNSMFTIRRLLFSMSLVLLSHFPILQIFFQFFLSYIMLKYLIDTRPYDEPILNRLELFNEICILIINYHLLVFTSFISDDNLQYKAGWSIIIFTFSNILVNMMIVFYNTFKKLKSLCHLLRAKYTRRKAQKYVAAPKDTVDNTTIIDLS